MSRQDELLQYLEMVVGLQHSWYAGERTYVSYDHLILEKGVAFREFGDELPKMESGWCFSNAREIAMADDSYTYCEGYGCSVLPLHHAWLVDSDDRVVDPTWGHLYDPTGYRGIRFSRDQLELHEDPEWSSVFFVPTANSILLLEGKLPV